MINGHEYFVSRGTIANEEWFSSSIWNEAK